MQQHLQNWQISGISHQEYITDLQLITTTYQKGIRITFHNVDIHKININFDKEIKIINSRNKLLKIDLFDHVVVSTITTEFTRTFDIVCEIDNSILILETDYPKIPNNNFIESEQNEQTSEI